MTNEKCECANYCPAYMAYATSMAEKGEQANLVIFDKNPKYACVAQEAIGMSRKHCIKEGSQVCASLDDIAAQIKATA